MKFERNNFGTSTWIALALTKIVLVLICLYRQ